MTRTMPLYEAYIAVENQRDLLKLYVWGMPLLTARERDGIHTEIARMTLWLDNKKDKLKFIMK